MSLRTGSSFAPTFFGIAFFAVLGCKDKELDASELESAKGEQCDPDSHEAQHDGRDDTKPEKNFCAQGLACERVGDGDEHVCSAPLEIRGFVYDAFSEEAIEGAHIAALDESGAPVTDVAISDAEGFYVLTVPAHRDADGNIVDALRWTLIASALDYQSIPGALRPSIPINAQEAVEEPVDPENDDEDAPVVSVIENVSTDVALIPLEEGGGVTISGHIGVADEDHGGGTLVVVEGATVPAPHGIADASGNYTIFNVPAGAATVRGYRVDLEVDPASVDVGSEDLVVDLSVATDEHDSLARVTGSVNIVNAPGGSLTSVVLVPSSVFIETLERGPVPLGLRAPSPPAAPSIQSAFEISGVPAGTYKVLAAFENDQLVRDPDLSIAGTEIVEITIDRGATFSVDTGFKVTEALTIVGPGADAPERVTEAPTFVWVDDSSETHYGVVVFDTLGNLVWEEPMHVNDTGGQVSLAYGGPALREGMYYQFRVTSYKTTPQGTTSISRSEDLRGVFVFGDPPSDDDGGM